jgi:hypothetical protein
VVILVGHCPTKINAYPQVKDNNTQINHLHGTFYSI